MSQLAQNGILKCLTENQKINLIFGALARKADDHNSDWSENDRQLIIRMLGGEQIRDINKAIQLTNIALERVIHSSTIDEKLGLLRVLYQVEALKNVEVINTIFSLIEEQALQQSTLRDKRMIADLYSIYQKAESAAFWKGQLEAHLQKFPTPANKMQMADWYYSGKFLSVPQDLFRAVSLYVEVGMTEGAIETGIKTAEYENMRKRTFEISLQIRTQQGRLRTINKSKNGI